MKERTYELGQHVFYFDEHGKKHDALITTWWASAPEHIAQWGAPGCNLVLVSGDPRKTDNYGQQIEHHTSVVHKSKQSAHGRFYCWADEL